MKEELNIGPIQRSIRKKEELLEAARLAVTGDRQLNYGAPEQNFQRIAKLWNAYMEIRTFPVQPWDIAALNILMKLARLANSPSHKDSWVDIAGYAACGYDITERQK